MTGASRVRQVGWLLVLSACFGLLLALTFKVNAVKSDVRLVERRIIAAEQAKLMLETEFQSRASQRQLSDWNAVEFGYGAPRADQYLENERQLAALGTPRGLGAPSPIRVAMQDAPVDANDGLLADLLEVDEEEAGVGDRSRPASVRTIATASLAQRLARPAAGVVAVAEVTQ